MVIKHKMNRKGKSRVIRLHKDGRHYQALGWRHKEGGSVLGALGWGCGREQQELGP